MHKHSSWWRLHLITLFSLFWIEDIHFGKVVEKNALPSIRADRNNMPVSTEWNGAGGTRSWWGPGGRGPQSAVYPNESLRILDAIKHISGHGMQCHIRQTRGNLLDYTFLETKLIKLNVTTVKLYLLHLRIQLLSRETSIWMTCL